MRLVQPPSAGPSLARAWRVTELMRFGRHHAGYGVAAGLMLAFLVLPWPLAEKLRLVLHGLCAQRPSHTWSLGGHLLPFDARMTGIFGGFLIAFVVLLLAGRARAWHQLSLPTIATLLAFVGVMGIDGVNSTLVDLGLWHAYLPRNELRLMTGALTGVSLAVLMVFLLATTLWRSGDRDNAVVNRPRELAPLVALQLPFMLAVISGYGVLYVPVALGLLVAAVTAVTAMALASLAILRRRDLSFGDVAELQPMLGAAVVVAVTIVLGLAGGRFALEAWLNVAPLG